MGLFAFIGCRLTGNRVREVGVGGNNIGQMTRSRFEPGVLTFLRMLFRLSQGLIREGQKQSLYLDAILASFPGNTLAIRKYHLQPWLIVYIPEYHVKYCHQNVSVTESLPQTYCVHTLLMSDHFTEECRHRQTGFSKGFFLFRPTAIRYFF